MTCIYRICFLCVVISIIMIAGCATPEERSRSTVKGYLDSVISTGSTSTGCAYLAKSTEDSSYSAIVGYVVRGYEIKNVSGNSVSVEVTFESKAETDLKKTLIFDVNSDNKITYIR